MCYRSSVSLRWRCTDCDVMTCTCDLSPWTGEPASIAPTGLHYPLSLYISPWHILHNVHHLFTNFCTMTLAKYSEKWYIYLYSVSFLDILKSDFVIPSCGLLRIKGMGHYIDWFDITEYIQLTLYMMYEVNKEHDKLFWCIDDDGGGKTNFQAYSGLKLADPSFLYSSVAVDLNKLPFCDGCVPLF